MYLLLIITLVMIAVPISVGIAWRRAMREHKGMSREDFIRAFSGADISEDIPAAVYDYYQTSHKEFSLKPDDRYDEILDMRDIYEDAESLLKRLGLAPPPETAQLAWNEEMLISRSATPSQPRFTAESRLLLEPVQTVREMVLWLNWVRLQQE